MKVEYITHMGDDLLVVNAARVSFDKHHDALTLGDERLIKYLAAHSHWTPFAHPHLCLRFTVPFFVANQLKRHIVGLVINEVSRRYVDTKPEVYTAEVLAGRPETTIKQGSSLTEFVNVKEQLEEAYTYALSTYDNLLAMGVSPENARIVLPLATYTSWYWTGSLYAFARIYNLRSKLDAQSQTREVAYLLSEIVEPLFPLSWRALTQKEV